MTAIVMVTHAGLGDSLHAQAEVILGRKVQLNILAIDYGANPDRVLADLSRILAASANAGGAVILTDLPGATPHNLAERAANVHGTPVVSGLNLPMLLKAVNHRDRPPAELAALASLGGHQGIVNS